MAKKSVVEVWIDSRVFEFVEPEWATNIDYHWNEAGLWVEAYGNERLTTMGFFPMSQVRAVIRKDVSDD